MSDDHQVGDKQRGRTDSTSGQTLLRLVCDMDEGSFGDGISNLDVSSHVERDESSSVLSKEIGGRRNEIDERGRS